MPSRVKEALLLVAQYVPRRTRGNLMVRALALTKIPMLALAGPRIEELTDDRCVVRIPLNWRTRNHLDVMYIGVLVAGADMAGGVLALEALAAAPQPVHLLFRDLRADFTRRADADVLFCCEQGAEVRGAVGKALETGERQNLPIRVVATTQHDGKPTEVARFVLTLTMKRRG